MERIRKMFGQAPAASAEYEPLHDPNEPTTLEGSAVLEGQDELPFSWIEYSVFGLLGMAMLWAWYVFTSCTLHIGRNTDNLRNMFLAAAPYFASRFEDSPWIQTNFQSAIMTVSTIVNLGTMLILTNIQAAASYPYRINAALLLNTTAFVLLTASTVLFLDAPTSVYFAFLLLMVAIAASATGLIQNGAFAFAASFGRPEYMQALMAGQGFAGVLPAVAQVVTVMLFPPSDSEDDPDSQSSAFIYFLAAVTVTVVALVAFVPLVRRHNRVMETRMAEHMADSFHSVEDAERAARKVTPLRRLFAKLRWLALGVGMDFAVTMFLFPVFTAKILSVQPERGLLFTPPAFIPVAFFFWNLGDLGGRMATMLPFSLTPLWLFLVSCARLAFLPLYLLCNIGGRGAAVPSDFFYLFVVQVLFGLTNGWTSSSCMMAAGDWVDEGEREAAGGFMGLCLVIGLTVGSLMSFTVSGI